MWSPPRGCSKADIYLPRVACVGVRFPPPAPTQTAAGKHRRCKYTNSDIDLFFILTGDMDTYLIPVEVVGAFSLTLDLRCSAYKMD